MKLYMEPIEVKLQCNVPIALRWRKRVYRVVTVAEQWTYRGRWWTDPLHLEGERRTYYRVFCDRAQLEIFHRIGVRETLSTPRSARTAERHAPWVLSRALD